MDESESREDVSTGAHAEPDEGLYAEVSQHEVELIGQLVHRRVDVTEAKIYLQTSITIYFDSLNRF